MDEIKEQTREKTPALSPAQYWEWRTTVTELQLANKDAEKTQIELKLLHKETEVCAIRSQLFQINRMEAAKQSVTAAQKEYERFTGILEEALGVSFKNKVIDDITFEVRNVPEKI